MEKRKRIIDILIGVMTIAMIVIVCWIYGFLFAAWGIVDVRNSTQPEGTVVNLEVASTTSSSQTFSSEEEMRAYLESVLPAGVDIQGIIDNAKKQ